MSSYTHDLVQDTLKNRFEYVRSHYLPGEPETYEELVEQRSAVNILVNLALADVCPLLSSGVQDTVKQILALHEEVWKRTVAAASNRAQRYAPDGSNYHDHLCQCPGCNPQPPDELSELLAE